MRKPAIGSCCVLLVAITGYSGCDAGLCSGDPTALAVGSLVSVMDVSGGRALVRDRRQLWAWVELAQLSARDAMPLFA
jgi:hypothetical protein